MRGRGAGKGKSSSSAADRSSRSGAPQDGHPFPPGGTKAPQEGHEAMTGLMIPASNARAIARHMSKRLEFLVKTSEKSEDPFVWYGLAMEYRSLSRLDEAVATFQKLRERAPAYRPMYLMCGQVLASQGRRDEAREWFVAGAEVARTAGDAHSLSELESALQTLSAG